MEMYAMKQQELFLNSFASTRDWMDAKGEAQAAGISNADEVAKIDAGEH